MGETSDTHIVVIDDSPTVLAGTQFALEAAGYQVTAASGPEQLDKQQVLNAQLLVIDVHMAETYGDDVVRLFRESWGVTAPMLLYSTLESPLLAERASDAGATTWVSKGDGVDALLTAVHKLLEAC